MPRLGPPISKLDLRKPGLNDSISRMLLSDLMRLCLPAILCIGGMRVELSGGQSCQASEGLPAASEVTRRMIQRAQAVAEADQHPQYTYKSRSVFEALNAAGEVIGSEEKVYQVEWISGMPFKRLVQIKGRDLTPEELEQEQEREEQFREKITSLNPKRMVARKESLVTPELLDRYRFEVKERVLLENRPTLVVTFKAKTDPLSGKTIQDRILNRLAGTLWIDEADADTAKLAVTLVEPLSLGWLGILGSLTRCDLRLERQRMPEGLWINTRSFLQIQCRKLAVTMRFRKIEQSSHFAKAE